MELKDLKTEKSRQAMKMIDEVKKNIGKTVICKYKTVLDGTFPKFRTITTTIERAWNEGFGYGTYKVMLYLNWDCVVSTITDENGKVIFYNPFITEETELGYYFKADEISIDFLGEEFVSKREEEEEARRKESIRLSEIEDAKARERIPEYIIEGKKYVGPEKADDWENFVKLHCIDSYSAIAFKGIIMFLKLLHEGKSFKEAEQIIDRDLGPSGHIMALIMQAIIYYHPNGEEYRKIWNKENGIGEEEKGVANPAVIHIR